MHHLQLSSHSIEKKIFIVRSQRVMLDSDLAELYCVPTFRMNEQVKRNIRRFPSDFMFQLNQSETEILTSQIAMSSWGGRRSLPLVFTEQGVAMLSSVLNSERAIQVNIQIMRAFIHLKTFISGNETLRKKITQLERKYDGRFAVVFDAIQKLLDGPKRKFRVKGFDHGK